ncbi:hypothetical protein [Actinokineospora sp.]|uniref:hypothetical protein n=1 Tax=Actinokineospora sp. TaxID=1872133 RepID=UPI0040378CF7
MDEPGPPSPGDPYSAVWRMTPVGDAAGHGRQSRPIAGIVAGLVVFSPFGLIVGILLGWWFSDTALVEWALIVTLFGLIAAGSVGFFVANDES